MKSIRFKVLAMLGIVAAGAILSAVLSLYALSRSGDLNARSDVQGEIALLTERLNTQVFAVVMDSRGIYMSKDAKEAEAFAKPKEARFPVMRKLAADLVALVPAQERETALKLQKSVEEFITFRGELIRLGREVSTAAANQQGNNDENRANRKALNDQLVAFGKRNEEVGNRLSDEAAAFTRQVQWILPSVLFAALLASVAAALLFAQRSITRPLLDLSASMSRLTAGETAIAVPHTKRQDEVGDMARAVAVLRQSTEQVALLQEQERAAAADRIRSADAMSVVVSDVGEVVAAAAAGDFSARLQIDDADEQMQKLVAGINEINAVVDGATTEFVDVLQALAAGDLTRQVPTAYRGRFAELKDAVNETIARLSETVSTIQVTASDVGIAAREINMGADDLSKRTEEQASSLEETAATTEELAASVKASAQGARQAAAVAEEAMKAAQDGGAIAGEAVSAMARIEDASKKISEIVSVIDGIAFQTNLLALNAAVEAARAGDAGKGFAVVASEVRTLAQRSGEAAKDISGLISSSNAEVEAGVKLVRRAGESLETILAASQKVTGTIQEISAAAGEQANGIEEMSQAVAHLDEMTQANAALAEQSAASAGALSGRIGELNTLVASFRTGSGAKLAMAPAPAFAGPGTRPAARSAAMPAMRVPARSAGTAPHAAGAADRSSGQAPEPERLRQLAEAAFAQSKAAAPQRAPAQTRKAANGRANDTGWEEF
ncbi:Methyl-accepting chemotaxis protein [Bosea sp. 62]|uniref:methyl-accepting chemotaxis protein n=1 Tax=unclassified Bosea (in: a-proteobacteria) TaxID=2653178 RepID=UPI001258A3BA|nr:MULTISPECIES: methyl-accepting chemotaxis protein [unclassified Bosea (in: a-proteobacteria)]CAD5290991.1 Methyl-accepting chemotaxis protein [Bosea sp. 7B]CAD5299900.1 Methyl-accepting chemotaxis protein [Bosea sp. 21B]CAD5300481.1 Methyl-accepting chemotaxis protein [Bosea sp. 46]VVT61789.1 Methyl-accepting chemotaxis protein [Bosea sp. EC-HK365B]VXB02532.1 Methyl-accepting chemotaxis protein [Bosea sp. 127]